MNVQLPERYAEVRHRLAWGVELHDPIREVLATGPRVELEATDVGRLTDHRSGRFSISYRRALPTRLQFIITDPSRRFVPRRLAVNLVSEALLDGVAATDAALRLSHTGRRISLAPGVMYPIPTGSTVLRGRIERGGAAERWARVEITIPSLAAGLLARATTDDGGEFVAVIPPVGSSFTLPVPGSLGTASIAVRARDVLPQRAVVDPSELDPFWDLPVELLPPFGTSTAPPSDDVADGFADAVGLRASTTGPQDRTFRIGKVTPIPVVTFT